MELHVCKVWIQWNREETHKKLPRSPTLFHSGSSSAQQSRLDRAKVQDNAAYFLFFFVINISCLSLFSGVDREILKQSRQ